jgi:hypothetical protein
MGIGNSVGVYHCINYQLIEIIFLIVMAVLIQLIVLYQPKDKKQSQAQE